MAARAETPPTANRIVERLIELGLDEGEARAFLHISSIGPSKAGELARALHVPRGEAYRVLQKLVEREFVTPSLSRPVEFRAVPIDQLFEDVLQQERRRISRIEESRTEIRDALARMQAVGADERSGASASFALVHGRRKILALADRMLAGSSDAALVAAHPAARAWTANWPSRPTSATLRALTRDVAPPPAKSARRIASGTQVGMLIVDAREVLVWITHDPSERLGAEGDVAFVSTSRDLVALQTLLFEVLWEQAAPR